MRAHLPLMFVTAMLAACSGARETESRAEDEQTRPSTGTLERVQERIADVLGTAPDELACAADADCVAAPFYDPAQPCCDTGVPLTVRSRAYETWRAGWKGRACAAAACAPMPSPHLPRQCAVDPRCRAGRCEGSCDDAR